MAHKDPAQLARLFKAVNHPRNLFLVHVDSKVGADIHDCAADLARQHGNVHVMVPRDVRWASYSVVGATLAAIAELLRLDTGWTHFSNLSGQDYPLQTQESIQRCLTQEIDMNFVEHFDPLTRWADGADRVRYVRFELPFIKTGFNVPRLRLNRWQRLMGDTPYYGGSSYFTLNRAFCEYMLSAEALQRYIRFFRHAFAPDEMFVHSLIMNSPFVSSVVNDNRRLIDFSQHLPRPRIYTMAERAELLASEKFYARKFDPAVDSEIIDLLEGRLGVA